MTAFKFEFSNINSYYYNNFPPVTIEAPNANMAIMKLAMEHDLSHLTAIYVTRIDDDDDESEEEG